MCKNNRKFAESRELREKYLEIMTFYAGNLTCLTIVERVGWLAELLTLLTYAALQICTLRSREIGERERETETGRQTDRQRQIGRQKQRQRGETMTYVIAGHIVLTPTQPVGNRTQNLMTRSRAF